MNEIIKVADAFKHLVPSQSLGEGIRSGFTWIGIKGKEWTLRHEGETKFFKREDGTLSPYLDVVIVGMNPNISKMYYAGSYNEDSAKPPDCASIDGIKPDPGVPDQQNPTCGNCRHNVWGSAGGGSRGKACQDHRKLAVLLMPYMTNGILEKPLLEPVYLKIPPGSLKAIKAYGDSLQHRGVHWATVVTRITFAPGKLFQMNFVVKQPLTNAEAPVILPLLESQQTKDIVGGTAGIYEEEQELPAVAEAAPSDTGLLAAFGGETQAEPDIRESAQLPTKRGRPPGSKNKPKVVETAPPAEELSSDNGGKPASWNEADSELEESINSLFQDKVKGMLT